MVSLSQLRGDVEQELTGNILPFYLEHALDEQQGGFYGRIDNDNRIHHQAAKGLIQNSRYLWTFSRAFRQLQVHEYRILADRAYAYLRDHFWDQDAGGLFWLVDYQGRPLRSDKYIYGQSYGVYGLSEYYLATGDESSLHLATTLFQLLEEKARDSQHRGLRQSLPGLARPTAELRFTRTHPSTPGSDHRSGDQPSPATIYGQLDAAQQSHLLRT